MSYKDYSTGVQWETHTSIEECYPVPFTAQVPVSASFGEYRATATPDYQAKRQRSELIPIQHYNKWDVEWQARGTVYLTWASGCVGRYRKARLDAHPFCDMGLLPVTKTDAMTFLTMPGLADSSESDALLQEALAQYYDRFDLGTFVGELGATVQLIAGVRRSIVRLLTLLPRILREASRAKRLGKPSQILLEWNFGWMGIKRDIDDIYEALTDKSNTDLFIGKASENLLDEISTQTLWSSPYGSGEKVCAQITDTKSVSARATVIGRRKGGRTGAKGAFFNPVITGYELIPYSWVVDYFFSVGDVLKALFANLAISERTSAIGYRYTLIRELTVCDVYKGSLVAYSYAATARAIGVQLVRIPRAPSYIPRFLGLPSVRQLLNAIALLFAKFH